MSVLVMAFALVAAINHLLDKNHILTFRLFQLISPNWNKTKPKTVFSKVRSGLCFCWLMRAESLEH